MPPYASLWLLCATAACSSGPKAPAKQADGGYRLSCRGALTDCLQRAERLCREEGYMVTEARDSHELLGHESGESQVEIRKSDAIIYCGKIAPPTERAFIELKRQPSLSTSQSKAPEAATPANVPTCVPGATQACVGPAGCHGGQACANDGSHYQACDCGKVDSASP